jgi:hypothetical protein
MELLADISLAERTTQMEVGGVYGALNVFLRLHPNPFVDEVRVEAMAQRDADNRSTGLGALLNDLDFEGFGVGTALWLHEIPT